MQIEQYDLPISSSDLRSLESRLEAEDLFIPTFAVDSPEFPYRAATYRRAQALRGIETTLVADRNLVSRWLETVAKKLLNEQHRLAATVMAFCHCSNILIEPNLALYEVSSTTGKGSGESDRAAFRLADNIPARAWSEIALGRLDGMPQSYIEQAVIPAHEEPAVDFAMPLKRWRRNYIIALKIGELELLGGSAEARMIGLIRWMHSDFQFGGPATLLAANYLAPNSPKSGLMPGLRSPDREKAISAVRNVAWDLTYLSDLMRRSQEEDLDRKVSILASLDAGLLRIGRGLMLPPGADHSTIPSPDSPFIPLWGAEAGSRIASFLDRMQSSQDDPSRYVNSSPPPTVIDDLVAKGEARLRSWPWP